MFFVTGNKNKVREAQEILGTPVEARPCDLVEIQSMSVREVSKAKVGQARQLFGEGTPFFIEDTGLFIDEANGFPGALVKYMQDSVGPEGICRFARGSKGYAQTVIGYCDKQGVTHFFSGKKRGYFVAEPKGEKGFGWDAVFVPSGSHGRTYAELDAHEKNRLSQRSRAFRKFKRFLVQS